MEKTMPSSFDASNSASRRVAGWQTRILGQPYYARSSGITITIIVAALMVSHFVWNAATGDTTSSVPETLRTLNLAQSHSEFQKSLSRCREISEGQAEYIDPAERTQNPRWEALHKDPEAVLLQNATLFDGEVFLPYPVDVLLYRGLVTSVTKSLSATSASHASGAARAYNLQGRFVTPGLVDMHSHHLIAAWPLLESNIDANEISPSFGPVTPFLRALDGLKSLDYATKMILSGGVTSSFIIPGSTNIMGGEGTVVKNVPIPGRAGEAVVEDMLLEHGVSAESRHRYMKMACGQNPRLAYKHTRMGLTWLLREHLSKAKELQNQQNDYCAAASALASSFATMSPRMAALHTSNFVKERGKFPEALNLESTVAMLRGRVAMHNHCYLPGDMETMIRNSLEFGFRIRAFHHATSAWAVPNLLKEYGRNLTIATFAETGLYKYESSEPNLYAPRILTDHSIPVALKSDHFEDEGNAKYLISQAATAHSFHLSAEKALQAVTSVPARALDLDYRIGYVRPNYDADLVVWNSHPLSVGALPSQIFVDGIAQLDEKSVNAELSRHSSASLPSPPQQRVVPDADKRGQICSQTDRSTHVITGIRQSYVESLSSPENIGASSATQNLTLVVQDGHVACFDTHEKCIGSLAPETELDTVKTLHLQNGFLLPGLTTAGSMMGLIDLMTDPSTGDGSPNVEKADISSPGSVPYAKYGISLPRTKGPAQQGFNRGSMGGVTRAIVSPLSSGGLIQGVSTAFAVGGTRDPLQKDTIIQEDVALHVSLKGSSVSATEGSVSLAVAKLRNLLAQNEDDEMKQQNIYTKVAGGKLPLLIDVENLQSSQQAILLKRDFPKVNVVVRGGRALHLVAEELAQAKIPVLLYTNFDGPSSWEARDALLGPPVTASPASILHRAGVLFSIILESAGQSKLHNLLHEAWKIGMSAGMDESESIGLVTTNMEKILDLPVSKDFVVWENNPFEYGGTVAMAYSASPAGRYEVSSCWPNEVQHL